MDLGKIDTITPTEYSKYRYIDRIVTALGHQVRDACDIGCGVGNILLVLEGRSIRLKGIDTSEESLAFARAKLGATRIELAKQDAFTVHEQYDLIFLTEVLEHLEDDSGMLRHLHDNVVRKNGYIIVTIPAHPRLYSGFDKAAGHYRRYGKKQALSMLKESGFEPLSCWSYGRFFFHLAANTMMKLDKKKDKKANLSFDDKTRVSAIRQYSGITAFLVMRVNALHKVCFIIDSLLRESFLGIEYCVLCRSR